MLVIGVDWSTSRLDLARFARSAGDPSARYAVDDRTSTLANMFGASTLGQAVGYAASGRILARAGAPNASELAQAVARAGA